MSQVQCVAVASGVDRSAWSSSGTTGVDRKFTNLSFVQKMSIVGEWVKNGGILPILCGAVLWINSPGSMKTCSVKRK